MLRFVQIVIQVAADVGRWWTLAFRSTRSISAENLFLRRQLALYIERGMKPRRIVSVTRIALVILSRFFHWRDALVVVRPPRDDDPLAPSRMEIFLATKVPPWSTSNSA